MAPVLPPDIRENAIRTGAGFFSYIHRIVRERRVEPGHDILSALIGAEVDGERLSDNDIVTMAHLLLVAGNETTRTLLTNAVAALLAFPRQLERLRGDPDLIRSAVEEILRFEPSVYMTFRLATEDACFGDTVVPAGSPVLACIASANRDEREFPEPHRFDITRTPNRHLSFASGIHFCLGAPLARIEAQVALPLLLRRFPHMVRGEATPLKRMDALVRGYATFPVFV
jgi:cytochrome P450